MAEQAKATPKKAVAARPGKHTTSLSTEGRPGGAQGGTITARCTCGWSAYDSYTRDRYADSVRATVQEAADRHKESNDAS